MLDKYAKRATLYLSAKFVTLLSISHPPSLWSLHVLEWNRHLLVLRSKRTQ